VSCDDEVYIGKL